MTKRQKLSAERTSLLRRIKPGTAGVADPRVRLRLITTELLRLEVSRKSGEVAR